MDKHTTAEVQVDQQEQAVRADIIEHIEARLMGTIDDLALATWAFDRFYAEELERDDDEDDEEDDEPESIKALDALMFGDDPDFRLDEAELRALVARLKVL